MTELDNPTINKIIQYIINELRTESRKQVELQLIVKRFGVDKKNVGSLIEKLKNNLILNYDQQNKWFYFKKNIINNQEYKKDIQTKEDFLQLLEDKPEGVMEDQNLYGCYKQIKSDIELMKNLKVIRFVAPDKAERSDKQFDKTILFNRNIELDLQDEGRIVEIPEIIKTE